MEVEYFQTSSAAGSLSWSVGVLVLGPLPVLLLFLFWWCDTWLFVCASAPWKLHKTSNVLVNVWASCLRLPYLVSPFCWSVVIVEGGGKKQRKGPITNSFHDNSSERHQRTPTTFQVSINSIMTPSPTHLPGLDAFQFCQNRMRCPSSAISLVALVDWLVS